MANVEEEGLGTGSTVGPYRIESALGEGGMGRVFRAVREPDGQVVALKVVKAELASDPLFAQRFLRELRAACEVSDSHLVGVVDYGEVAGRQFLAMDFVEGGSLEEHLEQGPLPLEETLFLAADVASGLDALHAKGLVHRDIKPGNIMLDASGRASLTDFGLARGKDYTALTKPGQVVGSIHYLAPELIRGEAASPAGDVYALGCVVYSCLSGEPPFPGDGIFEVGMAVLAGGPRDPCAGRDDVPPELGKTVLCALAGEPGDRPPTATAYANLLRAASGTRRF